MYTLYGAIASPYSMKMRSLLRYRRIPFVWVDGEAAGAALKQVRAPVIPVLEYPDGSFANAILSVDISTQAGAQSAIDAADSVSEELNSQRAQLGAFENAVSSTIRSASNQRENIAASQSRIQDTDYAQAVSDQVANDILSQASIALRGQANQSASSVLGLL